MDWRIKRYRTMFNVPHYELEPDFAICPKCKQVKSVSKENLPFKEMIEHVRIGNLSRFKRWRLLKYKCIECNEKSFDRQIAVDKFGSKMVNKYPELIEITSTIYKTKKIISNDY